MLDKYKDFLMINGHSWNTMNNYVLRMEKVLSSIKEEDFTQEKLTNYLIELKKNNSVSTVNGYNCAIRSYLSFLKKDIKLPKILKDVKTLPKSFDEKYFEETIINTLSQVLSNDFIKFRALFYFLFYSGVRISEIDTLKREHFDLNNKTAKIFVSKTKEERMVIYTEKTKDYIKEYFESEPEDYNAFGITSNNVKQRIKGFKKYFPDFNLTAHSFRHSFAVNCLLKGVDLLTVSKLLGHSNITTTMRYLGLNNIQIQLIYKEKVDHL